METWNLEEELAFIAAVREAEAQGSVFTALSDAELRAAWTEGKDLRFLQHKDAQAA